MAALQLSLLYLHAADGVPEPPPPSQAVYQITRSSGRSRVGLAESGAPPLQVYIQVLLRDE